MRSANDNEVAPLPEVGEDLRHLAKEAGDRLFAVSDYGDAASDAVMRRERAAHRDAVRAQHSGKSDRDVEMIALQMDIMMMNRCSALQDEKLQALRAEVIALGGDPDEERRS